VRDRGWPQIRQLSSASSRGAEEAGGTNDVVVECERLLPDGSFGRELLADRRQLVSHVRIIGSCTSKRSRRRSRQRSRPLRYFPPDPVSCSPDAPADLEGRATYHSDDQDLGCNLVAILALREGGSRRQLRGKSEGDGGDGHEGCEVEQHRLVVGAGGVGRKTRESIRVVSRVGRRGTPLMQLACAHEVAYRKKTRVTAYVDLLGTGESRMERRMVLNRRGQRSGCNERESGKSGTGDSQIRVAPVVALRSISSDEYAYVAKKHCELLDDQNRQSSDELQRGEDDLKYYTPSTPSLRPHFPPRTS
jgi:hypothetical protein